MSAGGKREGSGRKPIDPKDKKVQMVITIEPETREKIKRLAEAKGLTPGKWLEKIVDAM